MNYRQLAKKRNEKPYEYLSRATSLILAEHMARILNEVMELDSVATSQLLFSQASYPAALVGHKSIIVSSEPANDRVGVSMLGMLNGLLDIDHVRLAIAHAGDSSGGKFVVITPDSHPAVFEDVTRAKHLLLTEIPHDPDH